MKRQFESQKSEKVDRGHIRRIRCLVESICWDFGQKFVRDDGSVRWCIVVMQNPGIVLLQIWPFRMNIPSRTLHSAQIILLDDCLVFWEKFWVNHATTIKEYSKKNCNFWPFLTPFRRLLTCLHVKLIQILLILQYDALHVVGDTINSMTNTSTKINLIDSWVMFCFRALIPPLYSCCRHL